MTRQAGPQEERLETPPAVAGAGSEAAVQCPNCGTRPAGPYCQQCGQEQVAKLRPLAVLIRQALQDVLPWDTRVGRTLVTLLLRPGVLSCEYAAGHRVRYVPPVRLFLAVTAVYFLMLSAYDSSWFFFTSVQTDDPALTAATMRLVPKLFFGMVPIFALLLALLTVRQRRFYVEHLVFSLHFHAFSFLVLMLHAPLEDPVRAILRGTGPTLPEMGILTLAFVLEMVVPAWLWLAVHRFYRRHIVLALAQALLALAGYIFLLSEAAEALQRLLSH